MIISRPEEFRLHIPSNAIDNPDTFQGIINTSEKDFLKDKLGNALYMHLCEYYDTLDPIEYAQSVVNGAYTENPWSELLFYAQSMVINDAFTRYAYQQTISVNGAGINVVSGNDYGAADDRLLDKGVSGYRKEAMKALNNLLVLLEEWAVQASITQPITDDLIEDVPEISEEGTDTDTSVPDTQKSCIQEIVELWQQSKYYYLHADLLLPTCTVLNVYLDIEDYRDRFIRLLPDLHFIQNQYIAKTVGIEEVKHLLELSAQPDLDKYSEEGQYLDDVRYLMVSYLEQRTQVLSIDKVRRQQAHDESISLKTNILADLANKKAKEEAAKASDVNASATDPIDQTGYKNNQEGSRIFVSPLLY